MGYRLVPADQRPTMDIELWYDAEGREVSEEKKLEAAGSVIFTCSVLTAPQLDKLADELVTARKGGKADIKQGKHDRNKFCMVVRSFTGFVDEMGSPLDGDAVSKVYDMLPGWMPERVIERVDGSASVSDDEAGN